MEDARRQARLSVLRSHGADEDVAAELLAYNAPGCEDGRLDALDLPLDDEPHLAAWREYERDAERLGVFPALARRLIQLRFPIARGVSQSEGYRAATRRGVWPAADAPGLALSRPEAVSLEIHATPGGRLPVIVVGERQDFEALVRALSARNEPEPIPRSLGACLVSGLNNWDRVLAHRRRVEAERGGAMDEAEWAAELGRLGPRKELYQDRLILLSSGPYSAVPAAALGMDEETWRRLSLVIRREHECTHYFTRRALGFMRDNVFDEILADLAGLGAAFGRYDAPLALRFLGLERHPHYRAGGRLESYLGRPPLSPRAQEVLRSLVVAAVHNLERAAHGLGADGIRGRLPAWGVLTLEELASEG